MLAYLFTQRDVHSPTVKESLKTRLELGAQTHDALRPACPTSSAMKNQNQILCHHHAWFRKSDSRLKVSSTENDFQDPTFRHLI
jgi:hypothetical protein